MKKLHDLKIRLSGDAQLSKFDCMKIKGGSDGDLRRGRPTLETGPRDSSTFG